MDIIYARLRRNRGGGTRIIAGDHCSTNAHRVQLRDGSTSCRADCIGNRDHAHGLSTRRNQHGGLAPRLQRGQRLRQWRGRHTVLLQQARRTNQY